jgi:hypothetical protein
MSRCNLLSIATAHGLDDRRVGVRIPVGPRIFTSPYRPDAIWGPPIHLSNGHRGLKRQWHEADYLPPASAEVDLYIESHIRLHGEFLISKAKGQLYPLTFWRLNVF